MLLESGDYKKMLYIKQDFDSVKEKIKARVLSKKIDLSFISTKGRLDILRRSRDEAIKETDKKEHNK